MKLPAVGPRRVSVERSRRSSVTRLMTTPSVLSRLGYVTVFAITPRVLICGSSQNRPTVVGGAVGPTSCVTS